MMCHPCFESALSPAALLVLLGPGWLLAPAGGLHFLLPSGLRPQSSCDKVSPLPGRDFTLFLQAFLLSVSDVFLLTLNLCCISSHCQSLMCFDC